METALNNELFDAARERAGLSITKLAQAADLNPGTVSKLRSGDIKSPSLEMARRISDALRVNVDALFPRGKIRPTGSDGPRVTSAADAGRKGAAARWRGVPKAARSKQMRAVSEARWNPGVHQTSGTRCSAEIAALLGVSDSANDGASYQEAA